MAAVRVTAQCPARAFWGAGAAGRGVGDFGQDVGALEAELPGDPHDLVGGVGGQGSSRPCARSQPARRITISSATISMACSPILSPGTSVARGTASTQTETGC